MVKKKNILKNKFNLSKIKISPSKFLESTKEKITNYYTDFQKDREKEKKKAEKRRVLEEKKELTSKDSFLINIKKIKKIN